MIYGRSLFHSEYLPARGPLPLPSRPPSPPSWPKARGKAWPPLSRGPRRPRESGAGVNFLYCSIIERDLGAAHSQLSPDPKTRPGKQPLRVQGGPGNGR